MPICFDTGANVVVCHRNLSFPRRRESTAALDAEMDSRLRGNDDVEGVSWRVAMWVGAVMRVL